MNSETSSGLGGLMKPVQNVAQKASKAQKVKSIKVKVKFGDKKFGAK